MTNSQRQTIAFADEDGTAPEPTADKPLLQANGSNDEKGAEKKPAANKDAPKASLFTLARWSSWRDILFMVVGLSVAVITGSAFPLMAMVMGDISQAFVNVTILQETEPFDFWFIDYSYDVFLDTVHMFCMRYVLLGVVVATAAFIQVSCLLRSAENIQHRIRCAFIQAILRQDATYFDSVQSGSLTTALFDNVERLREGIGDKLGLLFQFSSQFVAGFIIAFTHDWYLTLIMLSVTPLLVICGAFIGKLMASSTRAEQEQYVKAGVVAEQALSAINTVVLHNAQSHESGRFESALDAGRAVGVRKAFFVGCGLGSTFLVMFSSYTLAFWVGTDEVVAGRLQPGTILSTMFSIMMAAMAMGQAAPQLAAVGTALGALSSIIEIIDRVPEIDGTSTEGEKPAEVKGHIQLKDVHFNYASREEVAVLQGVSMEARPGEKLALVGSSGCGKSTLLQLLQRFYKLGSGQLLIDGIPIEQWNVAYLRRHMAVVSQEPVLFDMTVSENVRMGRGDATDADVKQALQAANAWPFVSAFPQGVNTLVGERGTQLSGGQKQRIAIARALVRNPKILLFDEATSALDAESEALVQQALDKACVGRTVLIVAHRLSTVRSANRIVVLQDGQVAESGDHNQLMEKEGVYYQLVQSQVFADVDDPDEPPTAGRTTGRRLTGRRVSSICSDSSQPMVTARDGPATDEKGDKGAKDEKDKKTDDLKRLTDELKETGAKQSALPAILAEARPEWPLLALASFAALVQGCVFPAFSIFFTQILEVFSNTDLEQMSRDGHFWALLFTVLGLVMGLSLFTQALLFGVSAERLTLRLRVKLFRNLLRQPATYFDEPTHSTGRLCTRLSADAPTVKSAIDHRLGSVFAAIVSIGAGITLAFWFGWRMALLTLGLFPLQAAGNGLYLKFLSGSHANGQKEQEEEAGRVAVEAVECVKTVQALGQEAAVHARFCRLLAPLHRAVHQRALVQGMAFAIASSLPFLTYAALFRYGAWLIIKQLSKPMDVLRVMFAVNFSAGSVGFATAYVPEYAKARAAAGLIFHMLSEEPAVDSTSDEGKREIDEGTVEWQDVSFAYAQRPTAVVLKDLSLSLPAGRRLALVGSSGSGKSTVLALLTRLYDPTAGQVTVDGQPLKSMSLRALRSHIGVVSQEPTLFACSIRDNIAYGLNKDEVTDERIHGAAKLANIHEFISALPMGYETVLGTHGTQLSGGQKQRVAIARALIRNPKLLLLDEATSALDAESETLVSDALELAGQGRTVVVVAHRLSTIRTADHIAVLNKGRVVEQGTHAELMLNRSVYYELTQKQLAAKQ